MLTIVRTSQCELLDERGLDRGRCELRTGSVSRDDLCERKGGQRSGDGGLHCGMRTLQTTGGVGAVRMVSLGHDQFLKRPWSGIYADQWGMLPD